MKNEMKLSIIVPIYNMAAGGKLAYCLDSLLKQTIDDYEIIAVDDCSTDSSREILADYAARHPDKIRPIYSPVNKRQGGAKNLGLEIARGEWIGFVDADDWVSPDCYERLLNKAAETDAEMAAHHDADTAASPVVDMVGCDHYIATQQGMEGRAIQNERPEQTGMLDTDKYRSLILHGGHLVTKIYRRGIILDWPNRFPEGMFYEDNAIGISWFMRAKHYQYVAEPLYFYYQHGASTTHIISEERCLDRMAAARIMVAEARQFGYYDAYLPEIEYRFTTIFYVNTLFSYLHGMRWRPKPRFVKALGREMIDYFPRFAANPYFAARYDDEVKGQLAMHQSHPLVFMLYFKLLWAYRYRMGKRNEK